MTRAIGLRKASREEVFRLHASFCKALGDANRLLIIVELQRGPKAVNEIAGAIGASQPLTSRHLAVLREKGLVSAERDGSFVRYRLTDRRVLEAIEILLDVLAAQLTRRPSRSAIARRFRPSARLSA